MQAVHYGTILLRNSRGNQEIKSQKGENEVSKTRRTIHVKQEAIFYSINKEPSDWELCKIEEEINTAIARVVSDIWTKHGAVQTRIEVK
jgi:hypothetical protein